jgi:hypothetical protein
VTLRITNDGYGFAAASGKVSGRGPPLRIETFAMKVIAIALALLVVACKPVSMPVAVAVADPADPSAPVPTARYQSTLGTYVSQRPVEPSSWREQNERVAPQQNR